MEKQYFTVALLQILPGKTPEEAVETGVAACREAAAAGADLALFPEMWSCGYAFARDTAALRAQAVPADGPFARAFQNIAAQLGMAVGVTMLERYEPSPRNTLMLFDRFGRNVLTYAKVHTCDFDAERLLTRGEEFYVTELDTAAGPVSVGAMICYDREFPESARILMLKGAEVILVPNACPMEINRLSQLRARAFENMAGIATCNYPAGQPDCNGHSTAFDGVVYLSGETKSRDTCICEAGEAPGIYLARFDMDRLRTYRAEEAHGNTYRRPDRYGALVSERITPPFIRSDRRL